MAEHARGDSMSTRSVMTRLLSLFLPMLALSCASGSQDVDVTPTAHMTVDAHVGRSLTADSTHIADLTDHFAPHETVHAVIDTPGGRTGTMEVRWIYGGTG